MTDEASSLIDEMEAEALRAKAEFADEGLKDLAALALGIEDNIASMETALSEEKKRLERIMRYAIPDRLASVGVDEFGFEMPDGRHPRIKLEMKVLGSLNAAPDMEEAVEYLESAGMKGTIKSVIEIDYTEDEREEAKEMLERIVAEGRHPTMIRKLSPQTLMAFVRNKLAEDPKFDFAKVGTLAFPRAKFTTRK
jgi:hypothetical protein